MRNSFRIKFEINTVVMILKLFERCCTIFNCFFLFLLTCTFDLNLIRLNSLKLNS